MNQAPSSTDNAGAAALDALVPTNPLAAVACWTGIASVLLCGFGVVLGPLAITTGFLSRGRGALIEQSKYGKATSSARSLIGIVTGIVGTLLSVTFIILVLLKR